MQQQKTSSSKCQCKALTPKRGICMVKPSLTKQLATEMQLQEHVSGQLHIVYACEPSHLMISRYLETTLGVKPVLNQTSTSSSARSAGG